jgi:hypothetical protein
MATVTWTGAAGDGNFSTPGNWSNGAAPGNNGNIYEINTNASITLTAAVNVGNLVVTSNASVTLSGPYTLSVSSTTEVDTGSVLTLASTTTLAAGTISVSGAGTAEISGGTVTASGTTTLAAGQNLLLNNTHFTDASPISGAGTITLSGSTADWTGSPPSATVAFSGAGSTLIVEQWPSGMSVSNFGAGDVIEAGNQTLYLLNTGTTSGGNTVYDLVNGNNGGASNFGTVTLAAGTSVPGNPTAGQYSSILAASGGGYTICYCAGTLIATPEGDVAVEDLKAGDLVFTADGRALPVRWMGQSKVARAFAEKLRNYPIRISAGALGDGLPLRDLRVSPDHALFLEGVLVHASALVDGVNIVREETVPESFTYYHVELASHELLLAEGVAAESFVDNIERTHFQNWDARETPREPVAEMAYPRVKSARQVPVALRKRLQVDRAA